MFLFFFSLLVQARVRLFPESVLEPETKRECANVKKCVIRHCREQKNKNKNDKRSTFVSLVSWEIILQHFFLQNNLLRFLHFSKSKKKKISFTGKNKFIIRIC